MDLTKIEYGSLASSQVLNDNFTCLSSEIIELSNELTSAQNSITTNINSLSTTLSNIIEEYKISILKTGMILPTLSSTAPDGFLRCDGSELSRTQFSELYSVIGTTFGSNSSTTFQLPDLSNKTLWGYDGSNLGSILSAQLPNIKGTFVANGTIATGSESTGMFTFTTSGGTKSGGHSNGTSNPTFTLDASSKSSVYSDSCSTVQPPALVVNFIIKY